MSSEKIDKTLDPSSFKQQLKRELEAIKKARDAVKRARHPEGQVTEPTPGHEDAFAQALGMDMLGLAFSGGGIRSATFNLGVIQRLARHRLLQRVDYLWKLQERARERHISRPCDPGAKA